MVYKPDAVINPWTAVDVYRKEQMKVQVNHFQLLPASPSSYVYRNIYLLVIHFHDASLTNTTMMGTRWFIRFTSTTSFC